MKLLTVIVSHDRLPFLKETVNSYLDTVTVPYDLVIVDNASGPETREWLTQAGLTTLLLPNNLYPGAACNRGFRLRDGHSHLHRSDNDMRFLPGWCDWLQDAFADGGRTTAQVSLRTDEQEPATDAVGGNMAIRREAWDEGLRYTEEPWDRVAWEDGLLTSQLDARGWLWSRVKAPCTVHLGDPPDFDDPYYRKTYAIRGLPVPD